MWYCYRKFIFIESWRIHCQISNSVRVFVNKCRRLRWAYAIKLDTVCKATHVCDPQIKNFTHIRHSFFKISLTSWLPAFFALVTADNPLPLCHGRCEYVCTIRTYVFFRGEREGWGWGRERELTMRQMCASDISRSVVIWCWQCDIFQLSAIQNKRQRKTHLIDVHSKVLLFHFWNVSRKMLEKNMSMIV